jgi:hypothetical protein
MSIEFLLCLGLATALGAAVGACSGTARGSLYGALGGLLWCLTGAYISLGLRLLLMRWRYPDYDPSMDYAGGLVVLIGAAAGAIIGALLGAWMARTA